jgi:hypothetical protein
MSAILIAQLLSTFGPSAVSLIATLISKIEANGTVSAAEWATLTASVQQTAKQRMQVALTSAGIDPASAQGIALLNAAS